MWEDASIDGNQALAHAIEMLICTCKTNACFCLMLIGEIKCNCLYTIL